MVKDSAKILKLILPFAFVVGGFFVGLILEKVCLSRLKKAATKTKWGGDEIIIAALSGMPTLWLLITGIYFASISISLKPHFLNLMHKTLMVIIIFSATMVLARLAVGFFNLYAKKSVLPSTSIFANLTRLLVFLIGVLIILQTLGISITPILTALGVGGLAVALALQDTLSNLFSGLQIIMSRQIRPGDYVKLDTGEEGYVIDISWRNTSIKQFPNNMIIVPNSKLASAIVTNYNIPEKEMSLYIQVGVSYNSNLQKVEKVTIEVAKEVLKEVKGGITDFEPVIRYHTFADFSINFTVVLRVREFIDQYIIKHEFIKRLHKRYQEEGIEIPFPIRTVYMKDEKI